MGVLLDVVFGHVILQFGKSASANYIAWLTIPVLHAKIPVEEFVFYAMAPIATLLIYGWASGSCATHRATTRRTCRDTTGLSLFQFAHSLAPSS